MKYLLLILLISFSFSKNTIAQNNQLDSLWQVWSNPKLADTVRLKAMNKFIWDGYLFSQPDSAIYFSNIQLDSAKKWNNNHYISNSLSKIGIANSILGDNDKALIYFKKSYQNNLKRKDKKGMSADLINMGVIYKEQGNYIKAIEAYQESGEIFAAFDNAKGQTTAYNNIGIIYDYIGEYKTAKDYYFKALKIRQKLKDEEGVAACYINLGINADNMGNLDKALTYYKKALSYKKNKKQTIANIYSGMSDTYTSKGNLDSALIYIKKSLKLKREINYLNGISRDLINLGEIYRMKDKYEKALSYATEGLEIAKEINVLEVIKDGNECVYQVLEAKKEFEPAFYAFKDYIKYRDSLVNDDNKKQLIQKEVELEYEKEKAIAEQKNKRQLAIAEKEKENQKNITYAIGIGLVLLALFLAFVFNRLKVSKKQNKIIHDQKKIVDTAYNELEEKNQEITDSIVYAKRIQSAILPPLKQIKSAFVNSFVIYKPKDIVAGDFYWLEQQQNKTFIAVADCTGHGVPGAMVSVVCNNALNRSVREYGLTNPSDILNKTREIVIAEFEKSEEDVKDGMDIALCVFEKDVLHYAGAHNPLWIIKNGELIETKADKQPIGKFENAKPFTTHQIQLQKNDLIYIFSDGFADQFGGGKGKKFKTKSFKDLLISLHHLPIDEQKEIIEDTFDKWKGNIEQLDDVCVIGLKV